ncbi:MAG: hypothetical protein JSS95_12645 [Acidobacteria bacterium]|nr:hypothetical protein [Acidobacteriota bacterium]
MNSIPTETIALPTIHDAHSIQQALSRIIQGVAAGTLDNTRARILLSALKLAMSNLRSLAEESTSKESKPKVQAQHEEAPGSQSKAPIVTATQAPEDTPPPHFIHGNPAASSATIAPAAGSNISAAARYREKLQAAAMARSHGAQSPADQATVTPVVLYADAGSPATPSCADAATSA